MRRFASLSILLLVLLVLTTGQTVPPVYSQATPPVISILGEPDVTSAPWVLAHVSLVDPQTGRAIAGLPTENWTVTESGQAVSSFDVYEETTGVAVVIVLDRGGIHWPNDPRIAQAIELADALLNQLTVDGTESGDMVALVGIRGRQQDDTPYLTPFINFERYDRNMVHNELQNLLQPSETLPRTEVTPLYDGLQAAIDLIADNPDGATRDALQHRRPLIVAFSDGIDNRFSDETIEMDIIDGCRDHNILLYTIRMEAPRRPGDADNMQRLAVRTDGLYMAHNSETHDQVLGLLNDVVTQRQAYRLQFYTTRPRGDYTLNVSVDASPVGLGVSEAQTLFHSPLQRPTIRWESPAAGVVYTVPYSRTPRVEIPLDAAVDFPDQLIRSQATVRFYSNGVLLSTTTSEPYSFAWDVTDQVTETAEMREAQRVEVREFTFLAEVYDPYLQESVTSDPLTVRVEWPPSPAPTIVERLLGWLAVNWWLLAVLAALAVGFLVLLVLLIRTRGEVARQVVTRTTGVLKGMTQRLGAAPPTASAKLVILQGANMGKEFRLAAQVVKVGRDPQFCDFALFDEYVSNPHFSIQQDQTRLTITDENSSNGTRVNGARIPPGQRVPLAPDSIIEAGMTRLQLKRLGGTTRHLGAGSPTPPPTPPPGAPPTPPPPGAPADRNARQAVQRLPTAPRHDDR